MCPESICKNSRNVPFGHVFSICSLSYDLGKDKRWGYCPEDMVGIWTEWSEWTRKKVLGVECGGMTKFRSRICRVEPCKGKNFERQKQESLPKDKKCVLFIGANQKNRKIPGLSILSGFESGKVRIIANLEAQFQRHWRK